MFSNIQDFFPIQDKFHYFEIKICLIKSKQKWLIVYLQILFLKDKIKEKGELLNLSHLKLIHKVIDVKDFEKYYDSIINKNKIIFPSKLSANLDLITSKPSFHLLYRSRAKLEYEIDQPCYQIIKSGIYSKETQEVFKLIEKELAKSKNPYQNLYHACKTELNVNFGYQSILPHINIIIPIFLKILNVNYSDNKIYVILDYDKAFLEQAKLNIFNYSDNGKPFGKGASYESDQFNEIIFTPGKDAYYIKIELSYKNEIIEDLFEKIKSDEFLVDIEFITDDKKERKRQIKEKYTDALQAQDRTAKGLLFEQVVSEILSLENNLKTKPRIRNGIDEIDLLVINYNKNNIWSEFDTFFLVECKNENEKTSQIQITSFGHKLQKRHMRTGLFISVNGLAGKNNSDGAKGQVRDFFLKDNIRIVCLDKHDIEKLLQCQTLSSIIEDKIVELTEL
jgi:hypothetical protein